MDVIMHTPPQYVNGPREGGPSMPLDGEKALSLTRLRKAREGWLPDYMTG
jgi:hypothetical protein